jgi:Tol biopolymer transport system component
MHRFGIEECGFVIALGSAASAQVTQRVSIGSTGAQATGPSYQASVSADGRFMAFRSYAGNLVSGDVNGDADIFVRDRLTGTTEIVSVQADGTAGNRSTYDAEISADGRYVAFSSNSSNLVPGGTNGTIHVFVRDRQTGIVELVSVSTGGTQGNDYSWTCSISPDGRYVVFASLATNLVPGDTNGCYDSFLRDRLLGTTERVSLASGGGQSNARSDTVRITPDGRFVVFESAASNLVPGDTNGVWDIYVHDRQSGITTRASVDSAGNQGTEDCGWPSISDDGRFVAFASRSSTLVPGDTNDVMDVFVHDLQTGATERVSVDSNGVQGNGDSPYPRITGDGRYVAFVSASTNLAPGATVARDEIYVHDRLTGVTELVSTGPFGNEANGYCLGTGITGDGRFVSFESVASNLTFDDTNGVSDVFLTDLLGGPDFTSVCDAGVNGVIPCPCGNPPAGIGQGCDNSSATGGALLSASGGTFSLRTRLSSGRAERSRTH